jgi:hypothetical protein
MIAVDAGIVPLTPVTTMPPGDRFHEQAGRCADHELAPAAGVVVSVQATA